MFRLLAMLLATKRAEAAEREQEPWTCPECGHVCPGTGSRRHLITHRARVVSSDPLVIELRCHPAKDNLAAALRELRERWPGRKFTLLPASYGRTAFADGMELFTLLAIAD